MYSLSFKIKEYGNLTQVVRDLSELNKKNSKIALLLLKVTSRHLLQSFFFFFFYSVSWKH